MNNVNVNVTVNVNEIAIDINEADEILEDLQALTSLLFALADSAEGGSAICSECLIHLGKLSRDCQDRFKSYFNTRR